MIYPVITIHKDNLEIPKPLVIKYLGYGKNAVNDILNSEIDACISEMTDAIDFRACYTISPLAANDNTIEFSSFKVESQKLFANLKGCSFAIVFVATVGINADRLIQKYAAVSQTKAFVLNAVGTAAIEAFCNYLESYFTDEYKNETKFLRPRFSPGYGDFSIKYQTNILQLCQSYRKIGVSLTESLMMIPTKSVSAVIGVSNKNFKICKNKCDDCTQKHCVYGMR